MPRFSASTRTWEWTQVVLLVAALGWTTLCLGGYRAETMTVGSALVGALLAVHFAARAMEARAGARRLRGVPEMAPAWSRWLGLGGGHPAGWLLVPFLGYAALNVVLVSPARWLGWRDWLGWAQMLAVFWVVLNGVRSRPARTAVLGALFALGFVAVVLACYQRFVHPEWLMLGRVQAEQFLGRASGPFGIPNSLAALLLLLLPVSGALACRRRTSAAQRVFFGYLALVFALGLLLTVSRGGWLALLLVLLAWPIVGGRGSWRKRLAIAAAVAAGLGAVATVVVSSMPLAQARLGRLVRDAGERSRPILWRGAVQIFQEHRVWGSGAGSFNLAFERHRPAGFQDEPRWAHNEYLNTLSDYGAVGFVLFFGAAGAIAWRCARSPERVEPEPRGARPPWPQAPVRRAALESPLVRQALAAGLAAFALQLWVDFHFKIPALALAGAVLAAFWVQQCWPQVPARAEKAGALDWPTTHAVVALVVMTGTLGFAMPHYRAEALRSAARKAIDRLAVEQVPVERWGPVLTEAGGALRRAVDLDAGNGAAWADLSYATALRVWVEPVRTRSLAEAAERAAAQALACSTLDPEFWVRRGVALDLQGRWVEAGAALVHAVNLAPARALVWYHQAYHLSLHPLHGDSAAAAVEFCLRLDGGNREAQALRQRLAGRRRAP